MTALDVVDVVVRVCVVGWIAVMVGIGVREVYRDCVRARRARAWVVHRERHDG